MIWDDKGFLLSKNKYSENSVIAEVYTKEHGKVSGIIFGGTSKKIQNYLQIGNEIHVSFNSKSDNRIGYFKVEIHQALSPIYFDNPKKLACIISAMNLIKILTAELQKNKDIFKHLENFYILLDKEYWIKEYIFWELELFKILGYDLELEKLVDKVIVKNELRYFSKSSSIKKVVPNFLIEKNDSKVDIINLQKGLSLISDYLEKTILKPNNISQPISRRNFINIIK